MLRLTVIIRMIGFSKLEHFLRSSRADTTRQIESGSSRSGCDMNHEIKLLLNLSKIEFKIVYLTTTLARFSPQLPYINVFV